METCNAQYISETKNTIKNGTPWTLIFDNLLPIQTLKLSKKLRVDHQLGVFRLGSWPFDNQLNSSFKSLAVTGEAILVSIIHMLYY